MQGYEVGQKPPKLTDDGSFETVLGVRAFSVISNETGEVLSVDKSTGLLAVDDSDDE